jgi:two-component system OmpR family response regulator
MKPFLIFLVDDDPIFTKVLETQFKEQTHYDIKSFPTGEECLKSLLEKPDIIFLDYNLNSTNPKANNGLQILDKIKEANHTIPVVMISSQESIEVALNCIKHNAFEYIIKSEITFIRAKKSISILFNQDKLEKKVRFYKTTAITLAIWTIGTIISALISNVFYQYFFK